MTFLLEPEISGVPPLHFVSPGQTPVLHLCRKLSAAQLCSGKLGECNRPGDLTIPPASAAAESLCSPLTTSVSAEVIQVPVQGISYQHVLTMTAPSIT